MFVLSSFVFHVDDIFNLKHIIKLAVTTMGICESNAWLWAHTLSQVVCFFREVLLQMAC